jgi:hypothetical protein
MENKRWITGQEILDRWQGIDFELLRAFDAGLYPYDRIDAKRLTRGSAKFQHATLREKTKDGQVFNELEAFPLYNSELVAKLKNEFFKLSEVEEHERKHGITSPPVETVTTEIDGPAPDAVTIKIEVEGFDLENYDPDNAMFRDVMRAMSTEERSRTAKRLKEAGKNRREIAKRLYCHKLFDNPDSIENCMRYVTDLLK